MAAKKRGVDPDSPVSKPKKAKVADSTNKKKINQNGEHLQNASALLVDDTDFPRGGGSSFSQLEYKAIRAEALKEADDQNMFQDTQVKASKSKQQQRQRRSDVHRKGKGDRGTGTKVDTIRVEHLNYKRVVVGMKILCQVIAVQPLGIIVSLPNQLVGHVPITQISSQLTARLEAMDQDEPAFEEGAEDDDDKLDVPELSEIIRSGQYLHAIVTAVRASSNSDSMMGRSRDEVEKASRRVELSIIPEHVNAGVLKADIKPGFTLSAAVKSVEDHGYILDLGVPDVSGFLSFKEAAKGPFQELIKLHVGQLVDTFVSKLSDNGRTCIMSVQKDTIRLASLSEVTNVTSILPGTLVSALITAILPTGINVQILGFFEGTIDLFHLPPGDIASQFQLGQKVKARILYDITTHTPSRFALSLLSHVVGLATRQSDPNDVSSQIGKTLEDTFPIGTVLEAVEVLRVEAEGGLIVRIRPGVEGFVHISQTSDDHVPSLSASSGPWKIGTMHRARVTGHFALDGLLQLSLRQSVLEQKFLQVGEVQVGEVIKGTVKKLTDSGLFVSISGNVDGVIWPIHYADISLKHPAKRFKVGGSIKCRVLVVNADRKRIVLTAKRTLVDSDNPIITDVVDAKVGMLTHGVICKVSEKSLIVEFYNNVKAFVPLREVSELPSTERGVSGAFPVGKPIKVRILSVNPEISRIVASIRQAATNAQSSVADIRDIAIGDTVSGIVVEIHQDNAIINLQATPARALLSLKNLANHRATSVSQLRASLNVGESLEELIVVSRNPDKGLVIVANNPKSKLALTNGPLSIDSIEVGQIITGRVVHHARKGATIKLSSHIHGSLHPADITDNYETGNPFPAVESIIRAIVLAIDKDKKHLTLSTRSSRMSPEKGSSAFDREISDIHDLKVGETIRGFVKSVAEHGLFVTLGRDVDARVQIRELFDEYIKDWKSRFTTNQLVKGRILSVDLTKKQVEISFRSGDLKRAPQPSLALSDLHVGQKVDGRVKKTEDYGLFIEIDGSKLTGLCHKSEISDNQDADVTLALRSFQEGDHVKAVVLSLDHEKRRISLGLKPSYFTDNDFNIDDENSAAEDDLAKGTFGVVHEDEDSVVENVSAPSGSDNEDEEEHMEVDASSLMKDLSLLEENSPGPPLGGEVPTTLKLKSGFRWSDSGAPAEEDLSLSDNSSDEITRRDSGKKPKRRKVIEQDLTAEMQTKTPQSNMDFERSLLGSPNSSFLWIQYMSFQLQLSEIEKAREIGRRALQTINFREEGEKLNVWIALLNLENAYGTEEMLEATFKDAVKYNDSKAVHLRLAAIFDESEKFLKAEEQYKRTCKKFGQSSKAWTLFTAHYLRRGDLEQARKLLPRSLQSLDKRKHLKTISKFAQLEYHLGDPERGRTIFEGIVDSHPKRWDLWWIYIDMEAGQRDIQALRNLFDRVLALKLTSHKAKSFFKKWLELERKLGDEDGATTVKQKAVEWTQRIGASQ